MRAMLAVVLVCCAVVGLQAADLQNIQDAQPLNVDLSSQSDTAVANIAGTEVDETQLGGYRPLYPPYFPRVPTSQSAGAQPKSVYYDQEYYTRGAHPGVDARLDRHLKVAAGTNPFLPSTRPVLPGVQSVAPEARPDVVAVQPAIVGGQSAITDGHGNRHAANPFLPGTRPIAAVAPPTVAPAQPGLADDRGNRQIKITKSHFSHSASSSFSSSYSFRSVKFPSS